MSCAFAMVSGEGVGTGSCGRAVGSMAVDFRSMGMPELWRQGTELFRVGEVAVDVLAQVFSHLDSFKDMANARRVCKNWAEGVKQTLASRDGLSFAGWRVTDDAVAALVNESLCLRELNLWGCRITNTGLYKISLAPCCPSLISISLWGVADITDEGVVQLISRAKSLQHLNAGGTHITDVSVKAIATHCPQLRVLNLWGCRHVTEAGLMALSKGCPKLYSMNVWGVNIAPSTELKLLGLNSQLKLKLKPSQIRFPPPVVGVS
ncbi:hypothetical protein M758_4G006500 [Ceratodon purpureus]|nr:hypothetical protein M758_4G006500 [Ceratodon purpureus]